jgi:hypothetical protein
VSISHSDAGLAQVVVNCRAIEAETGSDVRQGHPWVGVGSGATGGGVLGSDNAIWPGSACEVPNNLSFQLGVSALFEN